MTCAERKLFTRKCLSWTHPLAPSEVFSGGFVKGSSKQNFGWLRTKHLRVGCGERIVKLTPCFGAATWFFYFSHLLLLFLYCFYRRCSVQWVAYRGTLPKEQNASSCSLFCVCIVCFRHQRCLPCALHFIYVTKAHSRRDSHRPLFYRTLCFSVFI